MSMPSPLRMLLLGSLALAGCGAVLREPGPGRMLSQAVPPSDDEGPDEAAGPARPGPVTRWADRQRFIFERAWREIREDLAYERIDTFANLEGAARRDVLAMRDDLAADRGAVTTSVRRRTPRRTTSDE